MVTLTDFLANLTEIVTSLTTMFTSIMSVFMEPPLVIYVGLGIFLTICGVVAKYLLGRRKG